MPNVYFDNYDENTVEHLDDLEDYPDPPRDPRSDPENPRQLEVALNRYRIRFNWREPNEDKTGTLAQEHEGLSPGQSKHVRYKIEVQKKPSGQNWQTVETEFVRHTYYVYHAPAGSADLLASYRARIWSVDEEDQLSQQWLNSNNGQLYSSTYAGGGAQLLGGGERKTLSFSYPGIVPAPKIFETGWTADSDYIITRISARVGIHDEDTHPEDGCVRGGPIYINIRKYNSDETFAGKVLGTSPNDDNRLKIGAGRHKDTAWLKDIQNPKVFENQVLAVSITKDPNNIYTGRGLVVNVVVEPM